MMSHPRCLQGSFSRSGFSLVELLVVVALIGVLVSITIPAVQAARESSRRMQCQSHLRQLALAAHNFESANRQLPSGGWGYRWIGYADISSIAGQPGSWTFTLLPHLDMPNLYFLGSFSGNSEQRQEDTRLRLRTPVPIYNCPSRRGGTLQRFDPSCETCALPIGIDAPLELTVRGDYAVNLGDGAPDREQLGYWPLNFPGPTDLEEAEALTRQKRWPEPPADWSGISWLRRGIRMSDITDGVSHVFLFGEKYVRSDAYYNGLDWGDNEPLYGGFNNDNHRSTHLYWPLMRDRAGVPLIGSFGSAHPSGANFAMADGSVHHVHYYIDSHVYRNLGNRFDGEPVKVQP